MSSEVLSILTLQPANLVSPVLTAPVPVLNGKPLTKRSGHRELEVIEFFTLLSI